MDQHLLNELTITKTNLLEIIASFRNEDFNKIPFEGSWTAAQVSEHIFKSVSGIPELLHAPAKPSHRDPNEKAGSVREVFLDFGTKMQSPEFVLPGNTPVKNEEIYSSLKNTMTKIGDAITLLDMSAICTVFELPGFGEFTRSEWVWFAIFHTQRHTQQLKNIRAAIANKKQLIK